MIRYLFNRVLMGMQARYDYDVTYMQEILTADLPAFIKMLGFQTMSSHRGNLPADIGFAVRLRAIIWDDCGPCTQLVVNMAGDYKLAIESGVSVGAISGAQAHAFNDAANDYAGFIATSNLPGLNKCNCSFSSM